eukprot:CAMPEP_0114566458 /NCGR_PEP_ID=MMETSP0114-20121206/14902_1 /TAXON_ID=31324 /ORGANISM="Goniomonas sp, Strain m" /LENGTH=30 /DNA_ID= /DNA_START= /DNA_END= /DNA_ORIENTATION=
MRGGSHVVRRGRPRPSAEYALAAFAASSCR